MMHDIYIYTYIYIYILLIVEYRMSYKLYHGQSKTQVDVLDLSAPQTLNPCLQAPSGLSPKPKGNYDKGGDHITACTVNISMMNCRNSPLQTYPSPRRRPALMTGEGMVVNLFKTTWTATSIGHPRAVNPEGRAIRIESTQKGAGDPTAATEQPVNNSKSRSRC